MCESYSNLTIKHQNDVKNIVLVSFIPKCEQISHIVLMFSLLIWSM